MEKPKITPERMAQLKKGLAYCISRFAFTLEIGLEDEKLFRDTELTFVLVEYKISEMRDLLKHQKEENETNKIDS